MWFPKLLSGVRRDVVAYSVVRLNEGVVAGDDVDVLVLHAVAAMSVTCFLLA